MEKENVLDKEHVKFEEVLKEGHIPFLGGRPERDTIIGEDEITNLKINLNVTKSVEEFLRLI